MKLTSLTCALLAATVLAAPAEAKKTEYPADPEALVCPPKPGDLDYALHRILTSAKFQEDPNGGVDAWRHKADGPFHLLSLEQAQWMHVGFKRFRTSAGTRLLAELRWQTHSYEFGVKEQEPYKAVQEMLDGLASVYPCVEEPA